MGKFCEHQCCEQAKLVSMGWVLFWDELDSVVALPVPSVCSKGIKVTSLDVSVLYYRYLRTCSYVPDPICIQTQMFWHAAEALIISIDMDKNSMDGGTTCMIFIQPLATLDKVSSHGTKINNF